MQAYGLFTMRQQQQIHCHTPLLSDTKPLRNYALPVGCIESVIYKKKIQDLSSTLRIRGQSTKTKCIQKMLPICTKCFVYGQKCVVYAHKCVVYAQNASYTLKMHPIRTKCIAYAQNASYTHKMRHLRT